MPRRDDLKSILILGSGPIVIGQAAEFDYSGTQACKVLRSEGYKVILVNSNPATIMTDPELADVTYVEPLIPEMVERILERERPDALLPTLGGQTALNLARTLYESGVLDRLGVELIGADIDTIARAEDRDLFRQTMASAGLSMPNNVIATTLADAKAALDEVGLPAIVRPAFTLGGRGGGIAYTKEDFERLASGGLAASPIQQILIDQSVIGWGEYELELMRDREDNVVVVCSIENIDPMGVHTGDSVTVAPQQTLTDRLYQKLRDQAIAVIRAVGVETGGANVQFAVNPETEEVLVIEMNPRVSRSSALASKATGFPIAKIAARLAVGYTLDEIPNDITRVTPASFEPTLDYVVVKWPRFAFEKFPGVDPRLSTHMKSVGEIMAVGRTFQQAFMKAMVSRELDQTPDLSGETDTLLRQLETPTAERYEILFELLRRGVTPQQIHAKTMIDHWYLQQFQTLVEDPDLPYRDRQHVYKAVDTCAAEFVAETPYFYSSWEYGSESETGKRQVDRNMNSKSIVLLGSGPNRIGQGVEFDYCCVHAVQAVREKGLEAVMINCNPETVSTDYDTSNRLYFEPLTLDSVLAVIEAEQPQGVIVQFGGQTPLKLAAELEKAGVSLIGTSVDSIDLAEDRGRFGELLKTLDYKAPAYATATSLSEALAAGETIGFPLLVRPSYVLGGRAMEIVYSSDELREYLNRSGVLTKDGHKQREIFLDRFLEGAIEIDVDALCDGENVWIGGIMQHVEEAGVHSGDSACVLPPHSLDQETLQTVRKQATGIARALKVVGLLNVQFAVQNREVYVIEANPRASRTVPFVSKAVGVPLAKLACRLMLGEKITDFDLPEDTNNLKYVAVKEAVLPFDRLPGSDALLGPEMRSTGEVMGIARDVPTAFAKAQAAAGAPLPVSGSVFLSVTDIDKPGAFAIAQTLYDAGFTILATHGTATTISRMGIPVQTVKKLSEGAPNIVEQIEAGQVDLIINTPTGSGARSDGWQIRRAAVLAGVPCLTTLAGGIAAARAIARSQVSQLTPVSLQELHAIED